MYKMYNLIPSDLYKTDLRDIIYYIKRNLSNPIAASNLLDDLSDKLNHIKLMPYSRPFVRNDNLAKLGYRSIHVNNYTLFYFIRGETVYLERFLPSQRDWTNILKDDLEDEDS